jgi:cytochrome d ubiquinol oxidase subunit II
MEIVWLCLVTAMITAYAVLDGFDIGAGIIHFCAGRSESDRRKILRSIGPVWDGNEVWLIAAGGTLYLAFPRLYASSFSGLYLPLMIVLWLLILRGISIEFRNHIESPVWKPFWDVCFTLSSALLAVFYGAALGNVIRGAPLDAEGEFFLPLWTNFGVSGEVGILDWYTVPVGVWAFLTLTQHGALWVALKTDGDIQRRCRRIAQAAWIGVALTSALVASLTILVQPRTWQNLTQYPWGWVFPILAVSSLIGILAFCRAGNDEWAFFSSCVYIAVMLMGAVFGIFPYVLPSNTNPNLGLTIYNTATNRYGLSVGLAWWIPGMILVIGYFVFVYKYFAGKVRMDDDGY